MTDIFSERNIFTVSAQADGTPKSTGLCVTTAFPKTSSLVFQYSKQTSLSTASYVQTVMRKGYFTDNVKYRFQTPTKYTLKHFVICTGYLAKRKPNTFH